MIIPNTIDILGFSQNEQAGLRMVDEVRRIGRKPEVFWNIASVWDEACLRHIQPSTKYMSRPSAFSCRRGHYHIVQKAIDMGREAVWVVEDDARFMKSIHDVDLALMKAPADADVLLLDYNVAGEIGDDNYRGCHQKMDNAIDGWWQIEYEDLRGSGDYIMSRDAMVKYAEMLAIGCHGDPIMACDMGRNHTWMPQLNIYAATPNISIQQIDNSAKHMSSNGILVDCWQRCRVNPNNYQAW